MKAETFKGKMENAYGRVLPTPVSFSGEYEHLTDISEVPDKEKLSDEDILSVVNAKRKASARQKAMNDALTAAGIEKPTLEDPQVQLATIIKALRAAGRSEEDAIQLAESTLGVKLAR